MTYVLGSDDPEIERLDRQAAWLERPTRLLLRAAGIEPGMRVLDLGTGLGHVAFALADMVGSSGHVTGIDSADRMLAAASKRAQGCTQIRFTTGDVRHWTSDEPFDAVVGRLILFHLPNAVDVVRHHLTHLRRGGKFIALDYDMGSCRTEPPCPTATLNIRRVTDAFGNAHADPMIGARLGLLLVDAGLVGTQSFGIQGYIGPDDPAGPAMLAGIVGTLAAQVVATGIATAEEIGMETLQARLKAELQAARSVIVPPTLAGAWGRNGPA